jgi:hypothetical protein
MSRVANKKKTKARLMRSETLEFTPGERLVMFYREHPVEACQDILGIHLMWHQRIMLREMWFKSFTCLCISRGIGKSYIFMIFAILKAMLYPDIQIGFVTPVYRQVQHYMFPEMEKMAIRSPLFKASIAGRFRVSTAVSIVRFKNGSFVEGLPPGNDGKNIRGRRYHVVLADEFAQIDQQIIQEVIRPMLNIQIHDRENQYHVASTPYYKWNHFWPNYLHHVRQCQRFPELFGLIEFDYRDVNETPVSTRMPKLPYTVSTRILDMQRADMTKEQYRMENMARFPDEASTYFSSQLLDKASPRRPPGPVEIEFSGDRGGTYVMGIDVARKVDNFAVAILKDDNGRRKLVRMATLNNMTYPEMHALVREFLIEFPISGIAIGQCAGGDAMKDLLAVPFADPKTGRAYPRILCVRGEDEQHDMLPGERIVFMVSETNRVNNIMYSGLKSDMEHSIFLFPPPSYMADNALSPKEEVAIKEIIATQNEFMCLQAIPTTHGHRFEPPDPKRDRKDRATAVVLANYLLSERHKEVKHVETTIPIGFWAVGPGGGE